MSGTGASVTATAHPNIALIKYWGKREALTDDHRNWALNPSLSLTLSRAQTRTKVQPGNGDVHIGGAPAIEADRLKVHAQLERVFAFLASPLRAKNCTVESANNFPAGTGMASSASAFAALTAAAVAFALGSLKAYHGFLEKHPGELSRLARLGSGSACRSVTGPFMKWDGAFAHPFASNWKLHDTILLFSNEHKKVPSTAGHALATSSPRFAARLQGLSARLALVEASVLARDLQNLGPLLETEALEMHAIAESSDPSVVYTLPETRRFLDHLRRQPGRDVFFTLDAGPNVHLISERPIGADVTRWLAQLGMNVAIWEDEASFEPVRVEF